VALNVFYKNSRIKEYLKEGKALRGETRGQRAQQSAQVRASMCKVAPDEAKLATHAAMAPEQLNLEATNLLIAGAVHFVVHIAQRSSPCGQGVHSLTASHPTSSTAGSGVHDVIPLDRTVFDPDLSTRGQREAGER